MKKGLERKQRQDYTSEFKLNVLTYMKTSGVSYSLTAIHFGISDIGMIANWNATFLKDGLEALFRLKGRSQNPMIKLKASKQPKTLTREQQLEEIKLLRIENEYLKKCHAHGIRPWSQIIKSRQELTANFKLSNILNITKFSKYWVNKMKQGNLN